MNISASYGVTPVEIEDVCFGRHIAIVGQHGRYILYGQAEKSGRYLKVVLARRRKNVFRPLTAFEMSEREKRSFRRRTE